MTVYDLNAVLLGLAFAGVWARGRAGDCSSFTVYLAACITTNRLMVWWPDAFLTWGFWLTKEWLYCALKAAIAIEIAWRSFAPFPRARAATVPALIAAVAVVAALLLGLRFETVTAAEYGAAVTVLLPRVQVALVWTYVALLAAVAWYRIPIDAFKRAILLGFLLYMGAYAGGLEAIRAFDDAGFAFYEALNPAAYAASVAIWTLAAWRPRESPVALPALSAPTAG